MPRRSVIALVAIALVAALAGAQTWAAFSATTASTGNNFASGTRGDFSGAPPAFDSCTTFTADATDYIGSGSGVIYDATLQAFPDDHATGRVDPLAAS